MKKRSIHSNKVMVAMKKRCHHLNEVSVSISRGSDWYKMKKDSLEKRKLESNYPEQERVVGKLNQWV